MADHSHSTTSGSYGMGRKTLSSYIVGLGLSLFFTFIAFALVAKHLLPEVYLYASLSVLAIMQLLAQVVYFLRMNVRPEGRWNSMPFIFTLLIIVIVVFGSLWIMYNMNVNMT